MNTLILAAGSYSNDSLDDSFPLCLAEFEGKPLLEHIVSACESLTNKSYVFAFQEGDISKFHLDNVVKLLVDRVSVVAVKAKTKGAACTALLASKYIDPDEELLVLNGNELLDADFLKIIEGFREKKLDAGVVTFSSIHPRYSYVLADPVGLVIEAAEKNTISRSAVVGFYWYKKSSFFLKSLMNMIRKGVHVNDSYYITPSLNELILDQAKIGIHEVNINQYHPLKNERQLNQFEHALEKIAHGRL